MSNDPNDDATAGDTGSAETTEGRDVSADPGSRDRDDRTGRDTHPDAGRDIGAMKWLAGIVSLIGLLVAATPFAYDLTSAGFWNNLIVGAAIFLIAGYNFYRMNDGLPANVGSAALVALLGLWLLASAFVIELGAEGAFWNNVVMGLLTALIAGYNAYDEQRTDTTARVGERGRA